MMLTRFITLPCLVIFYTKGKTVYLVNTERQIRVNYSNNVTGILGE